MSNDIQPTRQYSEREVRLILKTAVEMQQQRADRAGELAGGMSLVELEQVAVEAGLDPAIVRRAAAQLDTVGPAPEHSAFLGGPTHIVIERVVDVAINPARFDELLDVVRAVTHEVGEVSSVGRQFGWKGRMDGAKTEANVSAGDRRSTIRIRVELDEVALGHFMLKGTLLGIGGGLMGATVAATMTTLGPLGFGVGAAILGTGYAWSRIGFGRAAVRYRTRANELLDALVARAAEIARERDRA